MLKRVKKIRYSKKNIFVTILTLIALFALSYFIWHHFARESDPEIGSVVQRNRQTVTTFVGRKESGARQYAVTSNLAPVSYQDENGDWYEYDLTLVKSDKEGFTYELSASDFQVYFKKSIDTQSTVRIEREDGHLTMYPSDLRFINDQGDEEIIARADVNVLAQTVDNTITYPNTYGTGIDLLFTVTSTGVKKEIVIRSYDSLPPTFIPDANLEIAIEFEKDETLAIFVSDSEDKVHSIWNQESLAPVGTIDFRNENKNKTDRNYDGRIDEYDNNLFQALPAQAQDSASIPVTKSAQDSEIQQLLYKNEQNRIITAVQTPMEWLENATYPVKIDPSVGPNSPSSGVNDSSGVSSSIAWSNPSRITTSDNSAATAALGTASTAPGNASQYLVASNFGFAIDTDKVIDGVVLVVRRGASPTESVRGSTVQIGNYATNKGTSTLWTGSYVNQTYGGSSDTWNESLTPSQINNSNFSARVRASSAAFETTQTAFVDYISMTVYYSDSTPSDATLYNDDGGSNLIAFNNAHFNSTAPTFRVSAAHSSSFNRFQFELNTASDFSGTSYTQTFSGTYSSGTEYNLTASSLTPSMPTTNNATYYVRVRASADGGTSYSDWSDQTWMYTYKNSGDPGWFQTNDLQLSQNTLSGLATDGSGALQISNIEATGGTTSTFGEYNLHTFTSNGTFAVTGGSGTIDALVVAGGGGGGGSYGGGGGAGGLVFEEDYVVTEDDSLSVTVGSGGSGGTGTTTTNNSDANGSEGGNSSFDSISATGGGYGQGGAQSSSSGGAGGSGGGGGGIVSGSQKTGGSGIEGQGNDGGNGSSSTTTSNRSGGGGGGAGAVGSTGTTSSGGNGGAGLDYSSYFGTSAGDSGWFAGGGGGGKRDSGTGQTAGIGAQGGGGDGNIGASSPGENATANTGGGGGAGGGPDTSSPGGDGGSGIVIVRYIDTDTGTATSPEFDFDTVPEMTAWDQVSFSTSESQGDVTVKLLYTASETCDSVVPNASLSGNEAGFDVSESPIDISGLNTTTYNRICLQATLENGESESPALNEWEISWLESFPTPTPTNTPIPTNTPTPIPTNTPTPTPTHTPTPTGTPIPTPTATPAPAGRFQSEGILFEGVQLN